jgi:hypothetical protein
MENKILKVELVEMIEQETDVHVLEAIHTLLSRVSLNPLLKQKLTDRALKAETDITDGRLFTSEQVIARTNKL